MKKLKLITICAVVGLLLITAAPAMADDVIGPPWWPEEGQPPEGTVYAHWNSWADFPSTPGPLAPDDWESIPSGLTPSPYAFTYGVAWAANYLGRTNLLKLYDDDQLKFYMPNFDNGNEHKEVWIQVTYSKDNGQYPLFHVNSEQGVTKTESVLKDSVVWGTPWVTEAWSFQLSPNPAWEEIWLNFSSYGTNGITYVEQVVIDTWCHSSSVPEPATMALLGLGAIGLLRRKRSV